MHWDQRDFCSLLITLLCVLYSVLHCWKKAVPFESFSCRFHTHTKWHRKYSRRTKWESERFDRQARFWIINNKKLYEYTSSTEYCIFFLYYARTYKCIECTAVRKATVSTRPTNGIKHYILRSSAFETCSFASNPFVCCIKKRSIFVKSRNKNQQRKKEREFIGDEQMEKKEEISRNAQIKKMIFKCTSSWYMLCSAEMSYHRKHYLNTFIIEWACHLD